MQEHRENSFDMSFQIGMTTQQGRKPPVAKNEYIFWTSCALTQQ